MQGTKGSHPAVSRETTSDVHLQAPPPVSPDPCSALQGLEIFLPFQGKVQSLPGSLRPFKK
jgi:hypothetical protein